MAATSSLTSRIRCCYVVVAVATAVVYSCSPAPRPSPISLGPRRPPCSRLLDQQQQWRCAVSSSADAVLAARKCMCILIRNTAKPTAALLPFRGAPVAFISSSSNKSAQVERPAIVKTNPGTPPPMKAITGKPHREVPLPSQEGKQGAMQYALYVK